MLRRTNLSLIIDFIVGWIIGLSLLFFLRGYGIPEYRPVRATLLDNVVIILIFGCLAGILFGFIQVRSERYYQQRLPLGALLVISLFIHSVAIVLISGMIYLTYVYVFGLDDVAFGQFIRHPSFTVFFVYAILVNAILIVLRQVNLLLGPGNLMRFVRGEFYHPHEEVMIFMFLDLRSSTTIAEQLGHIRYSRLIQDCFSDLRLVSAYKARVYQYVGDEAVLTWKQAEGLKNHNCLRAFFEFEALLLRRADYYQDAYGMVPSFKAGMNVGVVTVAEVGVIKREIAFHGDTINTAARIEGMCNALDASLLISGALHQQLEVSSEFNSENVDTMNLRGKQETINLYTIEKTPSYVSSLSPNS